MAMTIRLSSLAGQRLQRVVVIVPMLCVGMQPVTPASHLEAERGASLEAFPRRAWERSAQSLGAICAERGNDLRRA